MINAINRDGEDSRYDIHGSANIHVDQIQNGGCHFSLRLYSSERKSERSCSSPRRFQ